MFDGDDRGYTLFNGNIDDVKSILQQYYARLDQIESEHLSYSRFVRNSNSVIGTILKADGFSIPQAAKDDIYLAPAIDKDLLDPNYLADYRSTQDLLEELKKKRHYVSCPLIRRKRRRFLYRRREWKESKSERQ